jgi:hypothetical protein
MFVVLGLVFYLIFHGQWNCNVRGSQLNWSINEEMLFGDEDEK